MPAETKKSASGAVQPAKKPAPPSQKDEAAFCREIEIAGAAEDLELAKETIELFSARFGRPFPALWASALGQCIDSDYPVGVQAIAAFRDVARPFAGFDPLRHAANCGSPRSLRALLALGADPGRRDRTGLTPLLDLAGNSVLFSKDFNQCLDGAIECVRALWEAGPAARASAKDGASALEFAASTFNDEPFHELLRISGADLALKRPVQTLRACLNDDDDTPIRRLEALRPFLSATDWAKSSALSIAAERGSPQIVGWLLNNRLGIEDPMEANKAISGLCSHLNRGWSPDRALIDRLLPFADLFLPLPDAADRPSCGVLEELLSRHPCEGPHSARAFPFMDQIAAFEPRQPGAKTLWEGLNGDPKKLPRLHARVEAELLRQTLGLGAPAPRGLDRSLSTHSTANGESEPEEQKDSRPSEASPRRLPSRL